MFTRKLNLQIFLKVHYKDLDNFLQFVSLNTMEKAFYFTLKALIFLKIFKFLSCFFGHVEKRVDENKKVNFNFYDVLT